MNPGLGVVGVQLKESVEVLSGSSPHPMEKIIHTVLNIILRMEKIISKTCAFLVKAIIFSRYHLNWIIHCIQLTTVIILGCIIMWEFSSGEKFHPLSLVKILSITEDMAT